MLFSLSISKPFSHFLLHLFSFSLFFHQHNFVFFFFFILSHSQFSSSPSLTYLSAYLYILLSITLSSPLFSLYCLYIPPHLFLYFFLPYLFLTPYLFITTAFFPASSSPLSFLLLSLLTNLFLFSLHLLLFYLAFSVSFFSSFPIYSSV